MDDGHVDRKRKKQVDLKRKKQVDLERRKGYIFNEETGKSYQKAVKT